MSPAPRPIRCARLWSFCRWGRSISWTPLVSTTSGELGARRVERTRETLRTCDVAVLVTDATRALVAAERELISLFEEPRAALHRGAQQGRPSVGGRGCCGFGRRYRGSRIGRRRRFHRPGCRRPRRWRPCRPSSRRSSCKRAHGRGHKRAEGSPRACGWIGRA